MPTKSNYLKNKIVNFLFNAEAFTMPASVYLALFTSAPTDAGGGTEVSGGSYARVAITRDTTNFPAATSPGIVNNAVAITMPTATALWGTVTHAALFDAATSGNLLYWAALTAPRVVASGDTFAVAIGQLTVTEV